VPQEEPKSQAHTPCLGHPVKSLRPEGLSYRRGNIRRRAREKQERGEMGNILGDGCVTGV